MTYKSYDVSTSYRAATPRRNLTRGTETNAVGSVISVVGGGASLDLSAKLDKSVFDDLFEKVNIGTADVPKYAIRAKYGLYTDDFLTGRGRPVSISGGGGGGASALSELNDVLLSAALAAGDLLQYDGTHWVNIPQNSLKPDLSGYATQEWVEGKGYALASSLAAHAGDTSIHVSAVDRAKWDKAASDLSSILGSDSDTIINKWEEVVAFLATYTEADTLANLLSNKADKTVSISAGAGLTGGGNLSANRTLALAASGVTAGTYTKVTVDAYGRVTAGTSLAASDIPTLDITKVSGLQTALAAKLDKSVFDDFFEKVNIGTSAAPKYAIRAKYGLYSNEFVAARGQSASIPGGGGSGESYNRLDSWADYTTDKAGYVLSAGLGWDLNTRVKSLETGSALTIVETGGGNAVTSISKSGTVVTVTKGATFLTSHQPLDAYMKFTLYDGYVAARFNADALAQKAASTYIEFWQSNAGWFNMKAGKYMIPNGTSSQFLMADGSVRDEIYFRQAEAIPNAYVDLTTYTAGASGYANYQSGAYSVNRDGYSELFVNFALNYGSASALQLYTDYGDYSPLKFRKTIDANRVSGPWRIIVTELNIGSYALTPSNYTSTLDSRYVNVSGDTMAGVLNIAHNSSNNIIKTQYNTAGDYTNVIYATVDDSRVIFGSPKWVTVELQTAATASGIHRRTKGVTYKMWDAGNDGHNSGLDADLLDGYHATSLYRVLGANLDIGSFADSNSYSGYIYINDNVSGWSSSIHPFRYGGIFNMSNGASNVQIGFCEDFTEPYIRQRWWSGGGGNWSAWKRLAFTSSNVASATKLQAARTLWGQSFDGTGNVSGKMTGVGEVEPLTDNTYDCGTQSKHWNAVRTRQLVSSYAGIMWIWHNGAQPIGFATSARERMRIDSSGNVGIGTSSPAYKLDVAGAIHSSVGVSSDGYVTARGQNSASDIRLKNHMADVTFSIDQIADAPLWRFSWRRDGSIDVGSIAQYWQRLAPELVRVLPDGVHLGLDYGKAALLASVSLAREHRDLAARVACLERENKQLRNLLKIA